MVRRRTVAMLVMVPLPVWVMLSFALLPGCDSGSYQQGLSEGEARQLIRATLEWDIPQNATAVQALKYTSGGRESYQYLFGSFQTDEASLAGISQRFSGSGDRVDESLPGEVGPLGWRLAGFVMALEIQKKVNMRVFDPTAIAELESGTDMTEKVTYLASGADAKTRYEILVLWDRKTVYVSTGGPQSRQRP